MSFCMPSKTIARPVAARSVRARSTAPRRVAAQAKVGIFYSTVRARADRTGAPADRTRGRANATSLPLEGAARSHLACMRGGRPFIARQHRLHTRLREASEKLGATHAHD